MANEIKCVDCQKVLGTTGEFSRATTAILKRCRCIACYNKAKKQKGKRIGKTELTLVDSPLWRAVMRCMQIMDTFNPICIAITTQETYGGTYGIFARLENHGVVMKTGRETTYSSYSLRGTPGITGQRLYASRAVATKFDKGEIRSNAVSKKKDNKIPSQVRVSQFEKGPNWEQFLQEWRKFCSTKHKPTKQRYTPAAAGFEDTPYSNKIVMARSSVINPEFHLVERVGTKALDICFDEFLEDWRDWLEKAYYSSRNKTKGALLVYEVDVAIEQEGIMIYRDRFRELTEPELKRGQSGEPILKK